MTACTSETERQTEVAPRPVLDAHGLEVDHEETGGGLDEHQKVRRVHAGEATLYRDDGDASADEHTDGGEDHPRVPEAGDDEGPFVYHPLLHLVHGVAEHLPVARCRCRSSREAGLSGSPWMPERAPSRAMGIYR